MKKASKKVSHKFPLKININADCVVKLTVLGEAVLTEYDSQFFGLKRGGWDRESHLLEAPMWELMRIFGKCMRMGADLPFEQNLIEFLESAT
jgi:hypothetical protein